MERTRATSSRFRCNQHNNYPMWKPPSSIDVDLPDGVGRRRLSGLARQRTQLRMRQFEPDLLCYIAAPMRTVKINWVACL